VGNGSARQRQGQVADAGLAAAERVGTQGTDRERMQAAGKDEIDDREVVRGEVPEHVHIRLHQPQVDPDRVDEQDLAEVPVGDELSYLEHGRCVAVGVIGHQHQGPVQRVLHHRPPPLARVCERFFHQDVFSRGERGPGDGVVSRGRGRDRHRVHGLVGEQIVQSAVHPHSATGQTSCPVDVEIVDRDEVPARARPKIPDQVRSPVARADDGDPQRVGHGRPPGEVALWAGNFLQQRPPE
jgi:hypothetical protein